MPTNDELNRARDTLLKLSKARRIAKASGASLITPPAAPEDDTDGNLPSTPRRKDHMPPILDDDEDLPSLFSDVS